MPSLPTRFPFFTPVADTENTSIVQNQLLVHYLIQWQESVESLSTEIRETLNSLGSYIEKTQYEMAISHKSLGEHIGLQSWVIALLIDGSISPFHLTDDIWTALLKVPEMWPNVERLSEMKDVFIEIREYLRLHTS